MGFFWFILFIEMQIKVLDEENNIVEMVSGKVLIRNGQDALDLMGEAEMQDLVLQEHNFEADFFDLKNGKLDEVLQKFTNYQVRLAIVGDFEKFKDSNLKDFIFESNNGGNYLFVSSVGEVLKRWI